MDISQNLLDVLPLYLCVVIGLSLLIMIGVFRSLLVPLVATGGFVLSLFATYGATVAVFQWGWFARPLGIHSTGPILSFLPIILVGILFGGFVFSESMMIRSIGFGLAFGVLADAFVVRLLLMPAVMTLLGKSAWWLPRWLDKIIPNVDVEGAALGRHHADLLAPAQISADEDVSA